MSPRPWGGEMRHTLSPQPKASIRLGSCRDVQRHIAVERRHGDITTKHQGRIGDWHLAPQVVALAVQKRMVLDVDHDVEVPRWTPAHPVFALAVEAQPLPGCDARRDLHREFAFLLDPTVPSARVTRALDDLAASSALPACAGDGEESLLIADLAAPVALGACLGGRARLGSRPFAPIADLMPWELKRGLRAGRCFRKRDLKVTAEVGPAHGVTPSVSACEEVAKPTEDVAEVGEDRRVEVLSPRAAAQARVPEAVVSASFVSVSQHRVRLGGLFELVLGRFVTWVAVGVVLERQLAVCALDLLVVSRSRQSQHFVIVALGHPFATLTMAGRSRRPPIVYPRRTSSMIWPSRWSSLTSWAMAW